MTRDDAINIMKVIVHMIEEKYDTERVEDAVNMAIKSLEQEPKWIPVSERLPETFDYVYCTCHSLIDDREDWVVETVYIPQLSDSPYSDWGNIPILNWKEAEVVAWMYRDTPKPYKAESELKEE